MGTISRGKSKHRPRNDAVLFGGVYPFIQTSDVKWSVLHIFDYSETYNEIGLQQSKLWPKGTLCITIAANIADTGILGIDACFPDSIMGFIADDKISDVRFVKYCFDVLQKQCQSIAIGTTQDNLSWEKLSKILFPCPPLNVQKQIADILSSLDDKIELNNAINRNLEGQAQILFKNFEENKPFNLMKIADVAEINPDSFGLKDDWSFVNYLDTSSITQNVISELQYINLNEEKLPSRAKRKVLENDVVYSTVRPNQLHFGFINEVKPNMLVSTGFAVIRSKNPLVSNEYIYLNLTKRDTIEKLQQIAEQSVSTFPAIKPSDIGDCLINVFEKKDAEILNNQLSAVFKKISQNNQENQRLTLIRDTLLPKLMSGEMGAMV